MDFQDRNNIYPGYDLAKLKLIGQGRQGKIYMLPNNRVLKVFYSKGSCRRQLDILLRGKDSRFFPTVFNSNKYCIVMNFIEGITLSEYLKQNTLDKSLSIELVKLIDEFKRLRFTRLDIRPCHIFVQANKTIKIIDPRSSFTIVQPYPLAILGCLKAHSSLEKFFYDIKDDYPYYYIFWKNKL